MLPKLLKAKEVAEILQVDKQRIYELVRSGAIPYIKVGVRQYRFNAQELERWVNNGGTQLSKDESKNIEPLEKVLHGMKKAQSFLTDPAELDEPIKRTQERLEAKRMRICEQEQKDPFEFDHENPERLTAEERWQRMNR